MAIVGYVLSTQVVTGQEPGKNEIDEPTWPGKQPTGNTKNGGAIGVGKYGHRPWRNRDSVKGDLVRYANHTFAG